MNERAPYNILFLCTGNSARSILAEAIMNRLGAGKFIAYSAGSHPKGEVHPYALKLLRGMGYPIDRLRSKSWGEFESSQAPSFDFIVTVCDNAAGEVCPIWPGRPVRAHWGVPDPAAVAGSDMAVNLAFADAYRALNNRIGLFASLPPEKLDGLSVREEMAAIGRMKDRAPPDAAVAAVRPNGPEMDTMLEWLGANGLATSDLADGQPRYFVLRDDEGAPLAFAGLAGSGNDLLLRSVVTDPTRRRQGAARRLIEALSALAAAEGREALWLLTTSSEEVFTELGWRPVSRASAPALVAASAQFKGLCPASAVLMCKTLGERLPLRA